MGRDIIVVGQQKTGTTGVYSLIKAAVAPMAVEYYFLFEPSTGEPIERIKANDPGLNMVAKIMYKNVAKFRVAAFQRRVLTVRDPRDTIVSTLLFKPMLKNIAGSVPMEQHQRFIDALRRKEAEPERVSIGELMRIADEVGYRKHKPRRFASEMIEMADFAERRKFQIVRYEDFVDGNVGDLAEYLGLPLNPSTATTSSWLNHISRSREHGAWRHWFTPSDIEMYRPMLAGCLTRIGYADDWDLASVPSIDPSTSSSYVADRLEQRRRELAISTSAAGESAEAVDIAALLSMADDGNAQASVALARRLATGREFGGRWPVSARYWAHRAELQGSVPGLRLRERLDRQLAPDSPASAERADPAAVGPRTPANEPTAPQRRAAVGARMRDTLERAKRAVADLRPRRRNAQ